MANTATKPATRRRWARNIGIAAALLLIVVFVGGFVLLQPATPGEKAKLALVSDGTVNVSDADGIITLQPANATPKAGFVFYPGGLVPAEAYTAHLHEIARAGFAVYAVRMPLNFAFLDVGAANRVIAAHPEITSWAIGGHSLGGAMSCRFATDNPGKVKALILWASFCDVDVTALGLVVASVYGTRDGLADLEDIENSKKLLPLDTAFIGIQGGNHAYFGDYGAQRGDLEATISRDEAMRQIVEATVNTLNTLNNASER